ncbi:MAG: autotransporter-associated beta strand repeat-containing protein, partial [Thermoguttaceae bacterium]|nr:autotransporter-associated beta strand repeat-containing protein [Thermoguttaceae bacterium]
MHRQMYRWIRRGVLLATSYVPTARMVAILLVAAAACLLAAPLPVWTQTTYTWNYSDQGGAWNTSGNWNLSGFPNASTHIAQFNMALTADRTISLGQEITVNQILFSNTGTSYTLTIAPSGSLTLAGTNPTIQVANPSVPHPTLAISAVLAGSTNWSKTGSGTLVLSGTNTYTGTTTVSAGVL